MGNAAAPQRVLQEPLKFFAAHFDGAEAGKVPGDELGVEQGETPIFEPGDEIDECDLARVAGAREHALAEKGAPQMHAVKPAGKLALLPDLHRMAMAEREQLAIEPADAPVDPGAAPS